MTSSTRASYFHKSIGGYHGAKLRRIQNLFDFHFGNGNMAVLNMLNVKYIIQGDQLQANPSSLENVWLVKELDVRETPNEEIRALSTQFELQQLDQSAQLTQHNDKIEKATLTINEATSISLAGQPLDVTKIMRSGISSTYVEDVNGKRDWIPTQELIKDSLNSFKKILMLSVASEFNPSDEAIVSQEVADKLTSLTYSGQGSIQMTSYKPNELIYKVSIPDEQQLAVFSEIYYPDGWKAFVNGEELPIHRVNYLLRGVQLNQGDYELTMKFEVDKYAQINTWTLIGSIFLLLSIVLLFVKENLLTSPQVKTED